MFIRDFVVAVIVGTVLLLLLGNLVGRVRFSLGTAFWCSLIGHALLSMSTFVTGIIFPRQLGLALIIGLGFGGILLTGLFQISVRAKGARIGTFRAVILSLIVILGGFLVASPLVEVGERSLGPLTLAFKNGNAYLLLSIGLTAIFVLLKPLSDGLIDTSLWVAKILAPADIEETEATKQLLKFAQASLMEGWLSNVPSITTIAFFLAVIAGFVYRWWVGVIMLFACVTLGVLAKLLWGRSASYYVVLLYHKMVNRVADYMRDGDLERLEAAESMCSDLQNIIDLYGDSRLRPPTPKQLSDIPYGDSVYWLEHGPGGA